MTAAQEWFDIVDAEGRVIGHAPRSDCHGNPTLLHRVVHVVVRNSGGEILLQKRSETKDIQPGKWDTSVGGHVGRGERVEDALLREAREEIGLAADADAFQHCYTYIMETPIESELVYTFAITRDGPFAAQPEEITELRFWNGAEIERRLGSGTFTPNFEDEYERFRAWEARNRA